MTQPIWKNGVKILLVTAPPDAMKMLPLQPMIRLLVDRIAHTLRDRVWTVRLQWGPPSTATSVAGQIAAGATVQAAVSSPTPPPRTLVLDPNGRVSGQLHQFLAAFDQTYGDELDLLVLDPTELFSQRPTEVNHLIVASMRALEVGVCVSYLVSTAAEWHAAAFDLGPTNDIEILPTVLLRPMPIPDHVGEDVMAYTDKLTTAWSSAQNMIDALSVAPLVRMREGIQATVSLWEAGFVFLRTGAGSAEFDLNDAWPINAIKLRVPFSLIAYLAEHRGPVAWDELPIPGEAQDQAESTFGRWARGVTARRVGVALGGGGALSYVAVPLLRDLKAAGIPVDIATGCSFGAIVCAYYSTYGDQGLDRIVKHWYAAQTTVLWGFVTSMPFQFWLDVDLGFRQIQDLEINFVPVATDARSGLEWPIRAGVIGQTCSASGAVPPLAPTYEGTRRLLDGAIAAEVPAAIAVFSGSNMVIGCNVIPLAADTGAEPDLFPRPFWTAVRSLNPMRRLYDFSRAYEMLYRQCSASQAEWANVTFVATTQNTSAGDFWKAREIIDEAKVSRNMAFAVDQARQVWLELQLHTAERVRFKDVGDDVFLVGDGTIAGPEAGDVGFIEDDVLLPASTAFLVRVAHFLRDAPWARLIVHVWCTGERNGAPPAEAIARRDVVVAALLNAGVESDRLAPCIHFGLALARESNHIDLQLRLDESGAPQAPSRRYELAS